jgi:hypothetical protein
MARGEDTGNHPNRKVGRAALESTTNSLFGAMDSLKAQLVSQGRYNPEWDKIDEDEDE